MADKPKDNKPLLPKQAPRGNYQIWVILATIAVILGVMYINNSNDLKEVSQKEFDQMICNGDVSKAALVKNQELVEITLTTDALKNAKYRQDISENMLGNNNSGPHYKLKIISNDSFAERYEELTKNLAEEKKPEFSAGNKEDYF